MSIFVGVLLKEKKMRESGDERKSLEFLQKMVDEGEELTYI